MKKNKQILKHCPNFYKIVNFEFFEDDKLSEKYRKMIPLKMVYIPVAKEDL